METSTVTRADVDEILLSILGLHVTVIGIGFEVPSLLFAGVFLGLAGLAWPRPRSTWGRHDREEASR